MIHCWCLHTNRNILQARDIQFQFLGHISFLAMIVTPPPCLSAVPVSALMILDSGRIETTCCCCFRKVSTKQKTSALCWVPSVFKSSSCSRYYLMFSNLIFSCRWAGTRTDKVEVLMIVTYQGIWHLSSEFKPSPEEAVSSSNALLGNHWVISGCG